MEKETKKERNKERKKERKKERRKGRGKEETGKRIGFGAEPGQVQQDLRPFNSRKPS